MVDVARSVSAVGAVDRPAAVDLEKVAGIELVGDFGRRMNCPLLMATRAKRPNPALDRPIRRWRDGDSVAGMRLYIFADGQADQHFRARS